MRTVAALAAALLAFPLFAQPGKPYTHQNFLDDPDEFSFAVLPDVHGADFDGEDFRGGLANAVRVLNLLRPQFVMSVGDLIPYGWFRESSVRKQHADFQRKIDALVPPFYFVPGNHDIAPSQRQPKGLDRANEISTKVWKEFYGENPYYSFVYRNCLFVVLNTIDEYVLGAKHHNLTDKQYAWFKKTLDGHKDVRWTFIFMHQPSTWTTKEWLDFEVANLVHRKYTVFAGDWHQYLHVRRHDHDYYVLSVAGGCSGWSDNKDREDRARLKGPEYGEIDHVMMVTMTAEGPVIANIRLDGVLPHDFVNQRTTKSLSKANFKWQLDYPVDPGVTKRLERLKAEHEAAKAK